MRGGTSSWCSAARHVATSGIRRCRAARSATTDALEWIPVSGRGRVYTYTVVYHATHAAMADKVPYIAALIDLDEGPRVLTNLRNCAEDEAYVGIR